MTSRVKIPSTLYDIIYERKSRLTFLTKLDNEVVRDGQINALRCNGFLSKGDLARYKSLLRKYLPCQPKAFAPRTLLDLGCGFGGLGRWLANELSLELIGIDFSKVAIEQAGAALTKAEATHITYKLADFSRTGIKSKSIAAIVSLDALYLADDPIAALNEAHRVLIPKGPLIFTLYVDSLTRRQNSPESISPDWPRMLMKSGFSVVLSKNVTNRWHQQMWRKHEQRWNKRCQIRDELGELAEAELAVSAAMLGLCGKPSFLKSVSRFEVIATRVS